jgi:phosphopantetheinyl transferase (holo-ACP synthase)
MTLEEYRAMPIETRPVYVAMVDLGDGIWTFHDMRVLGGAFSSKEGLIKALGTDEAAIFKLEFVGMSHSKS